jgi:hypothetical protein
VKISAYSREEEVRSLRDFLRVLRGPHGTLLILAIVGVVAIVGVTTAFATGGGGGNEENDGSETVKGSVAAPEKDGPDDEATQTQELQELAKIDQSTAENTALQAVPGTAKSGKLDNENGSVIYQVEVAGNDGQTHQVKVDAGNGKVLQQDAGEENESDQGGEEGSE